MKMCDEDRFRATDGKIGGIYLTHKTCAGIEEEYAFAYRHGRCGARGPRVWIRCAGAQKNDLSLRCLRANRLGNERE